MKEKLRKYQLVLFFALAYFLTWSIQIPTILAAHNLGYKFSNEANFLNLLNLFSGNLNSNFVILLLLNSFIFGPSFAGLIMIAIFQGKEGLREIFSQLKKYNLSVKWYLLIFLIPIALNFASLLLGYLLNGFAQITYSPLLAFVYAIPFLIYLIIFTGLSEETGWRGYALPELQKKFSAENSSWILGILWGLWHLPVNFLPAYLNGTLNPATAITMLLGLTLGTVGWTIVLTWIYNNTKSLFLIILLHGFGNFVQSYIVLSTNSFTAQIIFGVLPWVIAVFLLKKYGSKTLLIQNN